MADKNINIHVGVPGGEEAKQKLDQLGRSVKDVGNKTTEAGRKSSKGGQKVGAMAGDAKKATDKMTLLARAVRSFGAILVTAFSIQTVRAFFSAWLKHIKDVTEAQN